MSRKKIQKNISYDDVKKKYYVTLYYGQKDNGKPQKVTKTFSTKREAQQCLIRFENDKMNDDIVLPRRETVSSWLDYWLEEVVKPKDAETTYRGYVNISKYIKRGLGDIELQKLTPRKIQEYLNHVMDGSLGKKLSSNTAKKHHTLLKTTLKCAVKQDILRRNPAERVDSPKYNKPKISFYSAENILKLLKIMEQEQELKPAVYLAALLGLRREEICGLKWSNIDFESGVVYIVGARTVAGKEVIEKDTKNNPSTRKLKMDPILQTRLLEVKQFQKEQHDLLGSLYPKSDYVVLNVSGKPVNPGHLSSKFRKCIIKYKLPHVTLHGLRHSVASLANEGGATLFDISKMLGHSDTYVTGKVYTHLFDETNEKTVNVVAQRIREKKENDY